MMNGFVRSVSLDQLLKGGKNVDIDEASGVDVAKHGVIGYQVPDFSTKEKAQALAGINMEKEIAEKPAFKADLAQEWEKEAVAKGRLNKDSRKGMSDRTSYCK